MLTQCPNCQTVFRVTSKALRATHGYVRCGQCKLQFDAFQQLMDDDELETIEDQEANRSLQDTSDDSNPKFDSDNDTTNTFAVLQELEQVYSNWEFLPEDIKHNFNQSQRSVNDTDNETSTEDKPLSNQIFLEDIDQHSGTKTNTPNSVIIQAFEEKAGNLTQSNQGAFIAVESYEPTNTSRKPLRNVNQWPWATISSVLVFLLITQIFHHYKQYWVNHQTLGSSVRALYEILGYPLPPATDVSLYTSALSSMISDPQKPNSLRLQATITNQASFAQPYPWLSIRLENRFGTPIGARTFKPEEYLDKAPHETLMASGVTVPINLAIVDPGQDAVGVKIDTCLPLSTGLRCTHQGQ